MPGKVNKLFKWCKKVTEPYDNVNLVNMTTSWKSGLAFCAIIHQFRPDLIDFDTLSEDDPYRNNKIAFHTAEKELGIPALLDAEDLIKMPIPDRFSIATYVAQFYDKFKDLPEIGKPKRSRINASDATISQTSGLLAKKVDLQTDNNDITTSNTSGVTDVADLTLEETYSKDTSDPTEDDNLEKSHALLDQGRCNEQATIPSVPDRVNNNPHLEVHTSRDAAQIFDLNNTLSDLAEKKEYIFFPDSRCLEFPENSTHVAKNIKTDFGEYSYQAHGWHIRVNAGSVEEDKGVGWSSDYKQNVDSHQNYRDESSHPQCSKYERNVECINLPLIDSNSELHVLTMDTFSGSLVKDIDSNTFAQGVDNDHGGKIDDRSRDVDENMDEISDDANNITEKVVEERENAGNWGIQNNILEESGSDSKLTWKVLNTSTHQNHYSGDFGNHGDNFLGIIKTEKVDLENTVEGKGDNIDEDDPKRKTTFLEMKLSDLVTENIDNKQKIYGFENDQSNSIGVASVDMIGEYPDVINESEEKKGNCSLQIEVESERNISVLEMTIVDSMTETISNKDKISQLEKTESDPDHTSSSLVSVIANTTQATDMTQTGASVEVILPLDDVSCHIATVQTVVTGSISHKTGHGKKSESQVISTLHDRFDDIPKDEASDVISIDEVSDNLQNNANEIPPPQTEACVRHICEMASNSDNSDSGATSISTSSCEFKSCEENVFEVSGKSENVGEDIVESILISNHKKTDEKDTCEKADNFHGQDNVVDSMSSSETVEQSDIHAISHLAKEIVASIIMQTVAGSEKVITTEKGAGKEYNDTNETCDERMERISAHGPSSDPSPSEDDSDLELKQIADSIDTIILKTVFMDIESVDKDDNGIISDPRDIGSQNSEHLNGSIGTEMTNIDGVAKTLENYADCDHVDIGSTTETQAAGEACSVPTEIILTTDYNVHSSNEGTHVPEFSHQVEAADDIMSHGDNFDFNGRVFVDHGIKTMPLSSDNENSQYQGENTERKRTSLMVKLSYGGQSEDNYIQDGKDHAIDGIGSECKYMVRDENVTELENSPVVNLKEVEISPESHVKYEAEKIDCKIPLEDKCSHLQYQQNSNLHENAPLPSNRSIEVLQYVMHDGNNHASGEEDLFDKSSFEQNIESVLEQSYQGLELQSDNQVDKAAYSSGPAVFSSCLEAKEILTSAVTKQNKASLNYVGRNEKDKNTAFEMQDGNDGVLVSRDISEKNDAIMFCGFENSAVNSNYGSEVGNKYEMSDQSDIRFEVEEIGDDIGAFSEKGGETEFAELDLDIIKKAAIMAKQMAVRLSSEKKAKQEEEENMKNSDVKEEKESKEKKGSKDYHAEKIIFEEGTDEKTDPKANSSFEETVEKHTEEEKLDKSKISASVSRIQYLTRPTRFDSQAADRFGEDSLDNSYSQDFKRKMKLFSRAECNNGEPPQTNSDYAQRSGTVSDIFKRKLTKSTSFPTSSHSSDRSAFSGTISNTSCKGNVKSVLQQLENQRNERGYMHRPFEVIKTEGLMEEEVYDETKQWPMKMVSNKEPREIKLTVQPVSAKFEKEQVSENQVESILRRRESLTKTPDKTPRKVCVDIHPVMEQLQKGRENENDSELVISDKRLVRKQDSISDGVPSKLDIVIQPVTAKLDHSYHEKELPKANMLSNESNKVLRRAISGASHETGNTPQKHSIALHPVVAKPWSPNVTQTRVLVMPNVIFSKKSSTSLVHPKAELLNPVKEPPLPVSAKAIHEKMVLSSDEVSSEMVSSDLLRRNSSETKSPPPLIVSVRPLSAKVELEQGAKATEKTVEATKEKMFKTGFISPNSVRLSLHSTDNMVISDVTDQNNSLSSPSDMTQSNQRNVVSSGQGWFKKRDKSTSGFDKPGNISHVQSCLQKQVHKTGLEDTSEERKTSLLKSSSCSEADQSDLRPDDSRQAKLLRKTLSDAPKYTVRELVVNTATSKVLKSTKSIYETIKAYQGKDSELELKSKCSVTEPKRFAQDTASSLDSPTHEKGKSLTHVSTGRDSYLVHHGDQKMDLEDQNGCQEEMLKNQIQTVLLPDVQKNHDAIPPSHVISTVPEILSKDEESSPTSEGLHKELQPSRLYERPAVNGKAMEQRNFSIEALESETVIYKNGNVIVSEEIHSEKGVTELGASQIEMKTAIMATEIGMDTDQKAANVGMDTDQKAANVGMDTDQKAANVGMDTDQKAANVGMETDQKAANVGMDTDQKAANVGMDTDQKAANVGMEIEQKAANVGMDTDQKAANVGMDTNQKAANVGMDTDQKAANNVMETEQMVTNIEMEIEQIATNIVMEIEQKAVNIVMETKQMAPNIGMEIEQKAVKNVMEIEQMATNIVMEIEQKAVNIVMETKQMAPNIGMEIEQKAVNIVMETEQKAANIGMEIEQKAPNIGMEIDQKVANIGMETDQKAANIGMKIDQKAANIGMEIEQKAANIGMETDQMAANIEMDTGQEAVNIGIKTDQKVADIGIDTDQKIANIEMEIDQKAANIEMETYQKVANIGIETDQKVANIGMKMDQKATDIEIEIDQSTANIVMKTDKKAAIIEMETDQKVINIETDQKVAVFGMETDQKVANIGMGTSDMVTEIKLKIENDVCKKYLEREENALVVITGFKKDEGGLLFPSGSSDDATDLTVSKLEPHSINEKSGLHVESSLGLVTDESISEQEVVTTVSPVQSFLCGQVIDSETKKHCEETQIEVKAFSQYETGLVINNEFNEEKVFVLDEDLCSDKIKLDEVKTCSMNIFGLCTEEISFLSKPDDTLDGGIGVSKSHSSDLDHSGEESVFKEETIQPVYIETENTLPEFLIWRETKDSRTDEETSDFEDKKFVIGREKDPSKSEVARLIQQSLDLDRRREEMRIRDQEQMQALHDHFKPRDEVLEHEHLRRMSEGSERMEKEDTLDDDDSDDEEEADEGEESQREEGEEELVEEVVEEVSVSEEYNAGEATPMSMPSGIDTDNSVSSPEENGKVAIEVFDLQDSSSESVSPDMESQALFIKLKEVQTKNSVLEAELAKLKARIIMLEKEESHRKQYEKKCEDMAMRLRDVEKSLENAMREKNHYQDMLEGSQGQYIGLEKKMKGSYTALEKKYHKAKKLIKDYQLREKDFIQERESLLQQQIEKDQQYNALVKSLKDRIIQLEGDLNETLAAAGLPGNILPSINGQKVDTSAITKASTIPVSSTPKVFLSSSSPIRSLSGADTESISSGSEASSLEPVTSPDLDDESKKLEVSLKDKMELESVPQTTLLDTSASRSKGILATAGGLAARRPPTKKLKSSDSSESEKSESHDHVENRAAESESGLETWIKHDSDSTVRKNDTKKRKAAQPSPGKESPQDFPSYPDSPPPPPPPTQPPPLLLEGDTASEKSQSRTDEEGSEETLSQTSYDPTNPNFKGLDSEIPDSVSIDTTDTLETQGSGSSGTASSGTGNKKSSGKSISLPKLPFKFATSGSKDKGNGGIVLLSNKSLEASNDAPRSEGGITLISKKALNTGYDFDGASVNSDASSGYMVSEPDVVSKGSSFSLNISGTPAVQESPASQNRQNQFQSCAIAEWNIEHVRHWLLGLEMEKYSSLFTEKNITGSQLLLLDGNRLKTLGISDSKDRELLKKKIKEIKATADKERKQQEKEKKLQEKEQKLKEKEQKKQKKK
ncbi:hypothetical protein CHS0354_040599 [Potamilus streckersoni]|uniref:Uncharacterized protein n=1 Tax=Potamilus streckersoni TaxID=2493646 RepID=A0AAE0SH96_9BIVA|nr:hypothetical protein CHS0354_040599 [Potamilus streckersoni]